MAEVPDRLSRRGGKSLHPAPHPRTHSSVILVNAVVAGLGGLYVTTQSALLTIVAATLVAVLGVCSAASHRG